MDTAIDTDRRTRTGTATTGASVFGPNCTRAHSNRPEGGAEPNGIGLQVDRSFDAGGPAMATVVAV